MEKEKVDASCQPEEKLVSRKTLQTVLATCRVSLLERLELRQ